MITTIWWRLRGKEGQEDQPPTNTAHDISSFLQSERCCGGSSCLFLSFSFKRKKEGSGDRRLVSFVSSSWTAMSPFLSFFPFSWKRKKKRQEGIAQRSRDSCQGWPPPNKNKVRSTWHVSSQRWAINHFSFLFYFHKKREEEVVNRQWNKSCKKWDLSTAVLFSSSFSIEKEREERER